MSRVAPRRGDFFHGPFSTTIRFATDVLGSVYMYVKGRELSAFFFFGRNFWRMRFHVEDMRIFVPGGKESPAVEER